MKARRLTRVGILLTGAVGGTLLPWGAAHARPIADQEMPFACAEKWTGTTRSTHSPSSKAVDWNRSDDLGARVVASAPGVVSRVEDLGDRSYGIFVVIDHGGGEDTLYAHLSAEWVSLGQRLDQGQILGLLGTSGGSTGPHLHYEQRLDRTVQRAWFHDEAFVMGSTQASRNCPDTPIAGDWTGDGKADLGIFRRKYAGRFLLDRSAAGAKGLKVAFGSGTDDPLVGDWNGDGRPDLGYRRPGTKTFVLRAKDGSTSAMTYGFAGDRGLAGDWDGNGRDEVGVFRPARALFLLRRPDGTSTKVTLGTAGSLPLTGDWNGDKVTDLAVYDPATATYTIRVRTRAGEVWTRQVVVGRPGDLPVAGDWNGNGTDDLGTWRPSDASWTLRTAKPASTGPGRVVVKTYGAPRRP